MYIGEALKEAREKSKFTQMQVAEKLYVARQTISRWERNKTIPNIYVLKELSQLYGVSIEELTSASMDDKREEKEEMPKRKINYFAVFGGIIFNSFIFSGVAMTAILILVSLWLITVTFIFSPLILLILTLGGLQDFSLTQTILSIVFCVVGVGLYPLARNTSKYLIKFFKRYIQFNQKSIMR